MPLTRYQIRNEYSLADPELYRTADKDDPEALLEGVAMAGLVGVLRQLGDLAEFAAEIFHDLHEEVMATAARGHGLVVRVQQLESEFPTIEKAFLSQTSHSLFFYNTGVDWHPNLHMDQNLITQGDLPRFVMDSYEECRGPPRLFLLDKFDVAGAGACLKRYTDPSFFKVDSSSCGMTDTVQREKKPRKAKKKGSRWRNGETPEVLPTSHAKLHQLFLEESVESHVNDPSRRVKLKRRLNGFPFDSKTGKSYMEKFLKSPTHDHNAVHDIPINSSPLKLSSNITGESGMEIYDIITVSPHKELPRRKRSPFSSLDAEESSNKPYMDELNEELNDEISEVPGSNCIFQACNGASNLHEDVDEKEIAVDGERKRRGSLDSYQSDDIGSEVDNYMDALTTMDSEMETDSEYRGKSDMRFLNIDNQGMDSDANEEHHGFQAPCSDTQSIGNSTATDDGNNSSQKGIHSFSYSYSPSNLAENTLSDGDTSMKILSSSEMGEAEIVNMPSDQLSADEENASTQAPQHMVCNGVCIEESNLPSYRSHFGEPASSSCLTESNSMLLPLDQRKSLMEGALLGLESFEVSSHHNELDTEYNNVEENSSCPIDNSPCSLNLSDDPSLKRDNFHPQPSSEIRSMVVELDNEDPHVLSHVSAHLSNIPEFPEKKSSENLLDDAHPAECAEHECHKILADSQIDSPHSVVSHTEVLNLDLGQPEVETCDRDMEPNGIDFKKQQFPRISENILPHESSSYSKEENPDETSNSAHGEDLDGFSPDIDVVGGDAAEINFTSDCQNSPDPLSGLDAHLDDVAIETAHSKILTHATVVAGICCHDKGDDGNSVSSSSRKLQEETISITQDVCQDGMEINEAGSLDHLQESATGKEVDQQAGDSSDLDPSDASSQELLDVSPDSSLPAISGNSLHTDATKVPLNLYPEGRLSESKSGQQIDITESAENTGPSPTHDVAELRTPSDQKVELRDSQVDVESWHDQDSELRSSQQINVIDSVEDTSSSTNHYVAEWGTPMAEKFELQDGNFAEEPWHDQDSESNSAQQVNAIESTKITMSSTTCHVSEHRIPSEQKVELHNDQFGADSAYDQYLKSKSSQQINVTVDKEDAESPPTYDIAKPKLPLEEKVELQYDDQFDVESPHADKPCSEPFSLVKQIRSPSDLDQESRTDDFSGFSVSSLPSQPSVLELLPQSDICELTNKPSSSILPSFDIHAGISQINLNEMPPLPPLPPMQWRIGKVQHTFLASKRDPVGGNPDSFPHILPSTAGENIMEGKITQSLNPFLPLMDLEDEKSKPGHDNLEDYYMVHPNSPPLQVPPVVNHGNTQNLSPTSDGAQCTNPFIEMPTIYTEGSEHGFLTSEGGIAQPSLNPFLPVNNIEDTVSTSSSRSLPGSTVQPMHQSLPDTTLEDRKFEETSVISGGKLVDPPETASPSKIQDEQPQHMFSTSDGQTAWALSAPVPILPQEDGKPNGELQVKLPRPRNPLIDAVAALDKSKLRKVSERVRPQVGQKVDERDSLLEQIRTKSFNLKPAVATRPSIQGPKTNLKVTAILEKANAIRQAFAGSDEDDSDSWSDS